MKLPKFLSSIFTKQKILPGQRWSLHTGDPWERNTIIATILEVKEGWVKYKWDGLGSSTSEIKRFTRIYTFVSAVPKTGSSSLNHLP